MRKRSVIAFFFLLPFLSNAQSVLDSVNLKSLLFEKFIDGAVRMKSGAVERVPLNYNTDNQNIVFIKNGQYLVIADLEAVDTIYLQQKKFVPVNNVIYQVVSEASPVTLLVSYSNRVRPYVATTDKSGTSKKVVSQVSNTVSDIYVNRIFKGNYSVEILKHYWFGKNDKVYKANSKKQFLNSFTSKERAVIENYIANNDINFSNESDLIKLVDFCNTGTKELNN
jgi:hypothetical protein